MGFEKLQAEPQQMEHAYGFSSSLVSSCLPTKAIAGTMADNTKNLRGKALKAYIRCRQQTTKLPSKMRRESLLREAGNFQSMFLNWGRVTHSVSTCVQGTARQS